MSSEWMIIGFRRETEWATDEIRAIARFYSQRLMFLGNLPTAALADSLAVGYIYVTPLGFQKAALPTDHMPVSGNGLKPPCYSVRDSDLRERAVRFFSVDKTQLFQYFLNRQK